MNNNRVFTTDWFTKNLHELIFYVKSEMFGKENIQGLEIGSFEGLSTVWFINNLCNGENSSLHCIDTWEGSPEHAEWKDEQTLHERFMDNLSDEIGSGKCIPIRGTSESVLRSLLSTDRRFDFVYIDGSHESSDVLIDSIMSYMLLKPNGLMIFDDYTWGLSDKPMYRIPHYAIEFFRNSFFFSGKVETIALGQTAILRKIK